MQKKGRSCAESEKIPWPLFSGHSHSCGKKNAYHVACISASINKKQIVSFTVGSLSDLPWQLERPGGLNYEAVSLVYPDNFRSKSVTSGEILWLYQWTLEYFLFLVNPFDTIGARILKGSLCNLETAKCLLIPRAFFINDPLKHLTDQRDWWAFFTINWSIFNIHRTVYRRRNTLFFFFA